MKKEREKIKHKQFLSFSVTFVCVPLERVVSSSQPATGRTLLSSDFYLS